MEDGEGALIEGRLQGRPFHGDPLRFCNALMISHFLIFLTLFFFFFFFFLSSLSLNPLSPPRSSLVASGMALWEFSPSLLLQFSTRVI